ncbi:MAG: hypothetical protein ABSC22_13325 [Roseiarcus sp.]|jgi:hypothetical protein
MRAFAVGAGLSLMVLCGAIATPERPAVAAGYCPDGASHRVAQKVPAGLAPAVAKTFGVGVDALDDAAFVRCVGAKLMACWVGANLDCGQANTQRTLPGATAYCLENPGSPGIPMAATGHDTIYEWRCDGPRAVAGKIVMPVDAQGYVADNWKEVR